MKQLFLFILIIFTSCATIIAQEKPNTRILFVFDASNSMNGYWEQKRKMEVATRLLTEALDELQGAEGVELALRVYGHQTKHVPGNQDCDDTELVVPFAPSNNLVISKELERIIPQGTTPIARSLEKAAGDFPDDEDVRNVIILITDGIEACDEDPCAVSRALQSRGVILKPFIIGIGLDEKYKSTFECVGNYFDASKEESFKEVLDIVITQALNNTTVQINLLDENGDAVERDVPFSLYDSANGQLIYNYVHTINHKGNPDTMYLDPLFTYDMIAHTLPETSKEALSLVPGQHNHWDVKTPQGWLNLSFDSGRSEYDELKCIVRLKDSCEIVHIQGFEEDEKYLTGSYDLLIQTTPEILIEDVIIKQGETTEVKIPGPGQLLLQTGGSGDGGLFQMVKNRMQLVKKFNGENPSGRYTLQPGKYLVLFRSGSAQQTIYSIEKEISIKAGANTSLRL